MDNGSGDEMFSFGENHGVAAVEPAVSDCPPDSRILWFESDHKPKSCQSQMGLAAFWS